MSAAKTALVTGSSKGIGAAVARRLGDEGYHVFVTYHEDEGGAMDVVKSIQRADGSADSIRLDVQSEESVTEAFSIISQATSHLDLLVHNAVKEVSKPLADATFEEWRTVLGSKLDGAFLCTKAALPLFKNAESPSMIVISTFEGEQPSPDYPAYGVAASGVNAFAKAMALYLPQFGVRTNVVAPGPVRTPLWGPDEHNDDLWRDLAKANPVGRNATPEDVAETVLMVVTEKTRMLNGSFFYVNGGNHLRQA